MNRYFYTIFVLIILSSCTNQKKQKQQILKCDHIVLDEKMNVSLCFPTDNFEIERKENYFVLGTKINDTTKLSNVIFMVKVNDFKEKLSSDWYLEQQLKAYKSQPEINIETVNKSTQIIDGKEFSDLELVFLTNGKKIYSRTIFYFEGTIGYLVDANVLNDKINDKVTLEISSLFQTFRINGLPKN